MAKKNDNSNKTFNVSVVGLSGSEKEKGCMGVGKSCLCNRFVRPLADDYYTDHISVLSQTDFSGRVVNNDHWLYWGEVTKTTEEGIDITFSVIEHTEFIDDSCFQPFKTGKTEPYYKRCAATRLSSAEKLMYICKNQLGIEKEYEQKYLPEGKFNVDAFVCVFDVSDIAGRSLDKAIEYTGLILSNCLKTKKPIVLATVKHDEASELYIREAERLVNRKEFRGLIPIVETSAHENVNVDLAFFTCIFLNDRVKWRTKNLPYYDALRTRKEAMEYASEAYQSLIRNTVTDHRALWNPTYKKLSQSQDFLHYCDLFGQDNALQTFKRHVRKLKEDHIHRKLLAYLRLLPEIFNQILPDIDSIGDNCDWDMAKSKILSHPDFQHYFIDTGDRPWQEIDVIENSKTRIPVDLLNVLEAEQCFYEHKASLEAEDREREMKHQFKQLLQETGYVTPGKSFSEVRVLFMGRECHDCLDEADLNEIYNEHQREITERAKANFQELLLEYSELFYHLASLGSSSVITQEDIIKIDGAIQEDIRYKALDRLEQERNLMILRHLSFIHGPIREHCPSFPECMDILIENMVANKTRRTSLDQSAQWFFDSNKDRLNLVVLGKDVLAEELSSFITKINRNSELDRIQYTLDFRIINGDVDLPQYSIRTNDFIPQGCFCVYSNHSSLEYVRDSLEKTLLSNLEEEDRLSFHDLPIVILFAADSNINEKDCIFLREEGQNRAKSLQCPFYDVSNFNMSSDQRFDEECLSSAFGALIENIKRRIGLMQISQSLPDSINPDIRLLMCVHCGDNYILERILSPFFTHFCVVSSVNSIILDLVIGESKKFVELIFTSYHAAQSYRDELLHGFILVYCTRRRASLANLTAFSNNIPNTPTQIVAVCDDGTNIYYDNDDAKYVVDGNTLADKLQAHFLTYSYSPGQNGSLFTAFFREAWERKPQIEKAFEMEDSDYSLERRTPIPPPLPIRNDLKSSVDDGLDSEEIYEQLTDRKDDYQERMLSPSDDSEIYASVFNQENGEHLIKPSQIKNRRGYLPGYSYPPPPEPAPPDYPSDRVMKTSYLPIQRSFDEGWMENRLYEKNMPIDEWLDNDVYQPYLDRPKLPPLKPKPSRAKVNQPGKLNLKQFDNITDAVGRLSLAHHNKRLISKNNSALISESVDLPPDFSKIKNIHGEYSYGLNSLNDIKGSKIKSLARKNKETTHDKESDSDSDWSSLERLQRGAFRGNKKGIAYKKTKRRRAIPVAPPRLPSFENVIGLNTHYSSGSSGSTSAHRLVSCGDIEQAKCSGGNTPSGSDVSNENEDDNHELLESNRDMNDHNLESHKLKAQHNRSFYLRKQAIPQQHSVPETFSGHLQSPSDLNSFNLSSDSSFLDSHLSYSASSSKLKMDPLVYHGNEEECEFFSSDGSRVLDRMALKSKSASVVNDIERYHKEKKEKERKKLKEDEKNEKRRLKEEEKYKKIAEKKKKKQPKSNSTSLGPTLDDFVQSDTNLVPLFVEICIKFIEEEGLDSEGIYRVPGNRAHVDLLFNKFDEDSNIRIKDLDVPVNAVATALKDFFSKRLPPLIPTSLMDELTSVVGRLSDRENRLIALQDLIRKLPPANFHTLKFVFQHFVKITENSKLNSMDSKNLAICWWPTLLPFEFSDMMMFERMRPHLEESVQTMIDQFNFIFCDDERVLIL